MGIEFSQGHLHFYNFCDPNTPDRDFLDELIRRGIEGGRIPRHQVARHPRRD